ncbi:spoVR like family protein, partial [Vibrio parahaemolyticus V-223/04]
RTTNMVRWA